jgi:Sulfotransferase family
MIISHRYRFVFVHIHKTGGESVTGALEPFLGPSDILVTDNDTLVTDNRAVATNALAMGIRTPNCTLVKHSSADEIRCSLGDDLWTEYKKFTIVRHPVARAESLYSYLAGVRAFRARPLRRVWYRTARRREDPMLWPGMRAFIESRDFSEFLRHPAMQSAPAMKPQWTRISDSNGAQLVDFLARTETLAEDFSRLTSWLGLPGEVHLPRLNVSEPASRKPTASEADTRYLGEIFRSDFERLGYPHAPSPDY